MARKLRVEFAGACYHVIARENRRATLFHAVSFKRPHPTLAAGSVLEPTLPFAHFPLSHATMNRNAWPDPWHKSRSGPFRRVNSLISRLRSPQIDPSTGSLVLSCLPKKALSNSYSQRYCLWRIYAQPTEGHPASLRFRRPAPGRASTREHRSW